MLKAEHLTMYFFFFHKLSQRLYIMPLFKKRNLNSFVATKEKSTLCHDKLHFFLKKKKILDFISKIKKNFLNIANGFKFRLKKYI